MIMHELAVVFQACREVMPFLRIAEPGKVARFVTNCGIGPKRPAKASSRFIVPRRQAFPLYNRRSLVCDNIGLFDCEIAYVTCAVSFFTFPTFLNAKSVLLDSGHSKKVADPGN